MDSSLQRLSNDFYEISKYGSSYKRKWRFYLFLSIGVLGLAVLLLIIAAVISGPLSSENEISFPISNAVQGSYENAAVACDNGICSTIGKQMLQKGGSAIDAAIASLTCDGIVNMHNLGIGGGGVLVYFDSSSKTAFYFDGLSMAPSDISGYPNTMQPKGRYSIGIPGQISALNEAHLRFGKLSWNEILQPSIELCENGFSVGPALDLGIQNVVFGPKLEETQELLDYLTKPNSTEYYRLNDTMKCPELAGSLRLMAKEGPLTFYNGSLANIISKDFKQLKIPITSDDLLDYHTRTDMPPFRLDLPDGHTVYTSRPSASGAAAAFVLNILSNYQFTVESSQDPLTYHRFVEALKFAFGQIDAFGDETFSNATEGQLENLSNLEFGKYIKGLISDDHVRPIDQYGSCDYVLSQRKGKSSTSHISVLDEEGNAVSMTTTINQYFGSHVMGPRTGIIFNNALLNFNPTIDIACPANNIEPQKRPRTTISPMVIVNHKEPQPSHMVKFVAGASGSQMIIGSVPYVALRALWFGESPKQAVDAGRLLHQIYPDVLYHEVEFPIQVLDFLRDRGNEIQEPLHPYHSMCQAVQRLPNGTILAVSDYRKPWSYTDGY